ncbi:hypothetical protein LSH36_79g11050 [Paralvinella palmiformis]|uniref:Uncharacterized protein n=1 Tax=Paralvinella palmiformis TaxID=53620 RepID=A0AAD9K216_9ANNE|nr:hypothetical protein LSH36_79g11050 [Paralvinella palmiformis]
MDWTWGGLNEDIQGELHKANCVTIMSDGSIDVGIIEQELVYLQYVSDGLPKVKMVDVVDLNDGHADGVVAGVDRGLGKIGLSLKKFADGNSDFPNYTKSSSSGLETGTEPDEPDQLNPSPGPPQSVSADVHVQVFDDSESEPEDDDDFIIMENLVQTEPFVVYREPKTEEYLLEAIKEEEHKINMLKLDNWCNHIKSTKYHVCEKPLNEDSIHNHCHIMGWYEVIPHNSICNLKLPLKLKTASILVDFHNLRSYDSHLLVQTISKVEEKISCIPNNTEIHLVLPCQTALHRQCTVPVRFSRQT